MKEDIKRGDAEDINVINPNSKINSQTNSKSMPPKEIVEYSTRKLLASSEISLWLDSYDDIFSDFDPRPYPDRALSDDFLSEAKRASKDKVSGKVVLTFLIPNKIRNLKDERLIRRRLREHFNKHYQRMYNEVQKVNRQGFLFMGIGIIIMFLATFIAFSFGEEYLFYTFLVILLEPAGWFLFWEGLNLMVFESKKIRPERDFYEKMAKADIEFVGF